MNSEALRKKKRIIPRLRGTVALKYSRRFALCGLLIGGILGIPLHFFWAYFYTDNFPRDEDRRFLTTFPRPSAREFKPIAQPRDR